MGQDPGVNNESADNHVAGPADAGEDILSNQYALEDYRQRYGLSVDPFGADPYFPFFTGGQRRELLDQVVHLCQFGYGMPVIMGERGVGKTRAALALYESVGSDGACFIRALPTMDSEALLSQIAQYVGVGATGADTEQLMAALSESGELYAECSLALVLIDDAHDLDDQVLKTILTLMQSREDGGGGIQPVLFGDVSLTARLTRLNRSQVPMSDFYIERFTLGETVDYLNFRLEMADYLGPEMFTEEQVEPWWRLAQGQLMQIHRSAQEHLLKTVLPPLSNRTRTFPVMHIIAIAVLGSVVLMTLLYRGNKSEQELSAVQRIPINLQQPPQVALSPIADDGASSAAVSGVPVSSTFSESNQPQIVPINGLDRPKEQAPISAQPRPRPTATTEALTANQPIPANISSVAAVAAQSTPAAIKSDAHLSVDEEILLSWNASDFTLQLLGVSTEKAAKDFIANQLNRNDLLMFKSFRQGKDWFVVVAGRYPSVAAAKTAVLDLPQEQVKAGPWPREILIIQREIKQRVNQ